jgi:hypothetical protein
MGFTVAIGPSWGKFAEKVAGVLMLKKPPRAQRTQLHPG